MIRWGTRVNMRDAGARVTVQVSAFGTLDADVPEDAEAMWQQRVTAAVSSAAGSYNGSVLALAANPDAFAQLVIAALGSSLAELGAAGVSVMGLNIAPDDLAKLEAAKKK